MGSATAGATGTAGAPRPFGGVSFTELRESTPQESAMQTESPVEPNTPEPIFDELLSMTNEAGAGGKQGSGAEPAPGAGRDPQSPRGLAGRLWLFVATCVLIPLMLGVVVLLIGLWVLPWLQGLLGWFQ